MVTAKNTNTVMANKQLAPHEKALIVNALRVQFDSGITNTNWKREECLRIIKIAIKLSLTKNTINEMIDDYNGEYNRNFERI